MKVTGDRAMRSFSFDCMANAQNDVLQQLADVHQAAFAPLKQSGWDAAKIGETLNGNGGLVTIVSRGGHACGFALARLVADEAELITLAVHPAQQRRFLAERMLDILSGALTEKGVQRFFLEVRQDNSAAIALYRKLEFDQVATRKAYYQTQSGAWVDALILAKNLPPSLDCR